MDPLRMLTGILGRIGVIPHLGLHLACFRWKQTICGRRLCSVTACFSEEELADIADVGVAAIPPVADRPVNRSVCSYNEMDVVSVLSGPICDPLIRIDVTNAALTHDVSCTRPVRDI